MEAQHVYMVYCHYNLISGQAQYQKFSSIEGVWRLSIYKWCIDITIGSAAKHNMTQSSYNKPKGMGHRECPSVAIRFRNLSTLWTKVTSVP